MREREYSYGIELECGDIDTSKGLPAGWDGFSDTEYDLSSINGENRGLPNDPSFRSHKIGGELNSTPSDLDGQLEAVNNFNKMYPDATLNHRHDLHLHISYPGLKDDLEACKKIMKYVYDNGQVWLDRIYPKFSHPDMTNGDKMFCNITGRIMNSSPWRYDMIMDAESMEKFVFFHETDSTGKYNPRMGTRYAINLISLRKHGTIEFRANYPTFDTQLIRNHFNLITAFIESALSENPKPLNDIIDQFEMHGHKWTTVAEYDHYIQCAHKFCSAKEVGWKYMLPRFKEFKDLWEEDSARFYKNGWPKLDFAKFDKANYEI